jgi:hypothetical protein
MAGASYEALKRFFEGAQVAQAATRPLSRGARVNVNLADGPAHFTMEAGSPALLPGAAPEPDFTLDLPDGAVRRLTTLRSDDVGEFGVEFFKLVLDRDPDLKVRIHLGAPVSQLLSHGYLKVLAQGGLKVTWWLLRNGVKNPMTAIERLRGTR